MDLSGIRVGGHRGLRVEYPDNTLAGILAARDVCDLVELDTRRTADGVIVLSHDVTLVGHVVIDTPWEILENVDLGGGHHPARFEHLLDVIGDFPLDIEIKNSPEDPDFDSGFAFPLAVAGLARPQDVVTSFHWPTMDAIRSAYPSLRTGLLVEPDGSLEAVASRARASGHQVVAPHWLLLEAESAIGSVLEQGLDIVAWTVNDEDRALTLAVAGVSTIISDDPGRIRRSLRRHT
ncbi:MAG TPA: glycerophosphodiester phosphodiesterase [Actinobacteria bacterium]|nr:glycerophosphoryl diester phosphodiesterase [bacterium BMS3Bbin01]HDH24623.1 glycerophosphodiester phosphodiesterase [Actinomycetota bacterium]